MGRSSIASWILLALWCAMAMGFAWLRIPYDDEWFSIDLARTRNDANFLHALSHDVHPPWIAMLDRALHGAGLPRGVLNGWRVLCAAAALLLLVPLWSRLAKLPHWVPVLAAFHPIVLMYAGALRWYAPLMLAHALRSSAIWDERGPRRGRFVLGAVIGAASGYIDLLLLAHDSLWWWWRGRGQASGPGRSQRLATVLAAFAAPLLLWLASPLGDVHLQRLTHGSPDSAATGAVSWSLLGLLGEAAPPYPAMLFGAFILLACGLGLSALWRGGDSRRWALWLTSLTGCWMLASLLGVWHPRYSLMLWPAVGCLIYLAAQTGLTGRWFARFSAGYLAACLLITFGGRGFYKADLNDLRRRDCETVLADPVPDLILSPYRRLAEMVELTCQPSAKVVSLVPDRIERDQERQLQPVRHALKSMERVTLISNARPGSTTPSEARVRELVLKRCTLVDLEGFGVVPHLLIKKLRNSKTPLHRFVRERFDCNLLLER